MRMSAMGRQLPVVPVRDISSQQDATMGRTVEFGQEPSFVRCRENAGRRSLRRNMKSNLQYIFDKITRMPSTTEGWEKWNEVALIDLAIAIGAADRGVAISAEQASLIAKAVMAARVGGVADVRRLRASLNYDEPKQNMLEIVRSGFFSPARNTSEKDGEKNNICIDAAGENFRY